MVQGSFQPDASSADKAARPASAQCQTSAIAMPTLPMTAAGHAALQAELNDRVRIKRPQLAERIQQAIADDPNLVENSEYQAALTEQGHNEARIADLEAKLARAEVIDISRLSGQTIKVGATVTLSDQDTGVKRTCQIVGEPEADPARGKISVNSPIARALIGKSKGALVTVEAPGGDKSYRIEDVRWLP